MTKGKSIIGIMASLIALSACSEMTECAMETKPAPPAVTKVKEKIWSCGVEQMPSFPGGQNALLEYLAANVRYPDDCEDTCVQGRVIVSFIVETDGSITDVVKLRDIGCRIADRVANAVSIMPKWIPGKLNDKAVRVRYVLAYSFFLR